MALVCVSFFSPIWRHEQIMIAGVKIRLALQVAKLPSGNGTC
jgi:hypothetical protein